MQIQTSSVAHTQIRASRSGMVQPAEVLENRFLLSFSGELVSATPVSPITPGDELTLFVTVKNTGTEPWNVRSTGSSREAWTVAIDNFSWGTPLAMLMKMAMVPVSPGSLATFECTMTTGIYGLTDEVPDWAGTFSFDVSAAPADPVTGDYRDDVMTGNPRRVTFMIAKGQSLAISGTSGNDTITAELADGKLRVTTNGSSTDYDPSTVSSLTISGLAGNDTITIGPGVMACTIDGGLGDDSITGGDDSDSIRGDAGNDTIISGAGNDTIMGNTGDDSLVGGTGADCLLGGLGADTLDGGAGSDTLLGGDGQDLIHGGDGDDWIEGRGKADTIYGDAGNDSIYGGAGSDLIYGGNGDDLIDVSVSTVFHDTVYGEAGTDLVRSDSDDVLSACEGVWAL